MPASVAAKRFLNVVALALLVAISVVTAGSPRSQFNQKDKAFYMPDFFAKWIRPGLTLQIVNANISSAGKMTATVTIADPAGAPLDRTGATSPGPVTIECTMAVMPKGGIDFVSYTPLAVKGQNGQAGTEVWFDQGGTIANGSADGQYIYNFAAVAPTGFDITATHRLACTAIRDLTAMGASTYYSGATLDFVPGSSTPPAVVHDVVREPACESCHLTLAYHGGNAQGVNECVMCHTQQAADPTSGNTLYFPVMIHKIHMGSSLPSVQAGGKYQIYGYGGYSDFSTVNYPSDPGNCNTCHDPKYGAKQFNYYVVPTRQYCGSCHDNVNFATGANHGNVIQTNDTACQTCHPYQGTQPFDLSITNAHVPTSNLNQDQYSWIPGMVFGNLKITNTKPGQTPTITFTMKDKSGKAIALSELKVSPGRIAAVLGGNTWDYGWDKWGSDVTTNGYVSEDVTTTGTCDTSGNCTYTFVHGIPKDAQGTYTLMLEGRRALTIQMPNGKPSVSTEVGAHNATLNFSVDGSPVTPRRTVVDLNKCNNCHSYLTLHGANRDRIEACVICHNPKENDGVYRATVTDPKQKALPPETVNFSYLIHRIHGGQDLTNYFGIDFAIVGYGSSVNDFSQVRYPVMNSTGATANLARCDACHANNSQTVLPEGLLPVATTQDPVNPMQPTTAACYSCHASTSLLQHALANTTPIGESCSVCHGPNGQFAVATVHAQ